MTRIACTVAVANIAALAAVAAIVTADFTPSASAQSDGCIAAMSSSASALLA